MVLLRISISTKIQEKNKKFLWFVISLDNKIPKNLNKNIVIFLHNNLNPINFIPSILNI